ncbi:MAG: tRNA lysidine(34) synthetase TilS, partial [Magnetococcales bacterium]|nr:tRNA lysidine(34) synthetase TilS [Magnetococcales bacterium]
MPHHPSPPSSYDPLLHRFTNTTRWLLTQEPRIVVAVSGGADSMALLHLLLAGYPLAQTHLMVAHFDHTLRTDSHLDATFVHMQAQQAGVTCQIGKWETARPKGNLQEQARKARWDFLTDCARNFQAIAILTGHHLDDQAETFLERLLRGSGVTGLAAIRPVRNLTKDDERTSSP